MNKTILTAKQVEEYNKNGYFAPINIFSIEQVKKIREDIESVEKNGYL